MSDFTKEEIKEMTQKEFRKNFPSGWMEVSRFESIVLVIDALLESPTSREFTLKELADKAGVSKRSLENRIDALVELGVIIELPDREKVRYTLNEQSPITQEIFRLNTTVERVKNEEIPKTLKSPPEPSSFTDESYNTVESSLSTTSSGNGTSLLVSGD